MFVAGTERATRQWNQVNDVVIAAGPIGDFAAHQVRRYRVMSEQPVHPAKAPLPREPNAYPGGKQVPGGLVPPYEGRQTTGKSQEELAEEARRKGHPGHEAGPREVSQAEQEGVPDGDTTAATPLGVGVSKSNQGNKRMYGRSDKAHVSDQVDTGVGGYSENIDPESPTTIVGNQGH
jgi:hypothetical protein